MNLIEDISSNSWNGAFRRISIEHPLDIYLGKDEFGHIALEFKGCFVHRRVPSLKSFMVKQIEGTPKSQLFIILLNQEMIGIFSSFIEDIITSTKDIKDEQAGYDIIVDRIFSWCKMFQLSRQDLTESQVKGLIGELLFLKSMLETSDELDALRSWAGPDKAKKDFSFDNNWWEIKTINVGKSTVQISSIEQLDSDNDGELIVYELEKMSELYNGLKLMKLASEIYHHLITSEAKDLLLSKLADFGYDFSNKYDCFVYELKRVRNFLVNTDFPRLSRNSCHKAIADARYDLSLNELLQFEK
jgi:hypothetical protein